MKKAKVSWSVEDAKDRILTLLSSSLWAREQLGFSRENENNVIYITITRWISVDGMTPLLLLEAVDSLVSDHVRQLPNYGLVSLVLDFPQRDASMQILLKARDYIWRRYSAK